MTVMVDVDGDEDGLLARDFLEPRANQIRELQGFMTYESSQIMIIRTNRIVAS